MGKWLVSNILSSIFSGFRSFSLALSSSSSSSSSSEHDTDPPKYSSKSLVTNNEIVYRSVIMAFQFILLSFGLFQLIRLRIKTGSLFKKPLLIKKVFHILLCICISSKQFLFEFNNSFFLIFTIVDIHFISILCICITH